MSRSISSLIGVASRCDYGYLTYQPPFDLLATPTFTKKPLNLEGTSQTPLTKNLRLRVFRF